MCKKIFSFSWLLLIITRGNMSICSIPSVLLILTFYFLLSHLHKQLSRIITYIQLAMFTLCLGTAPFSL